MLYRFSLFLVPLLSLMINNSLVFAQNFKNFNEFKQLVDEVVISSTPVQPGEEVQITLVQLNDQMTLPSCPAPIETSIAQSGLASPSNSVVLQCHGNAPWELFVPVQIKIMKEMLIAARRIMPNEVVTENDVIVQKRDKFQVYNDYFYTPEQISGLVAAHLILEGSILSSKNLRKALMVHKNQNINLILKHGGIEISMAGIAKTDGYLNETVKVLNPSSKKMVDALVTGPNNAQIEY